MILFTVKQIERWNNLMLITKGVEQEPEYHPEGDVWTHSFQCLGNALRETKDTDLILAAWFHDIGKAIIRKGHEKESVRLMDDELSPKTLWLIKNHMRVRTFLSGEMHQLKKVREILDSAFFPQLIHLRRLDAKSRKPNRQFTIEPRDLAERLNDTVRCHFEHNKAKRRIAWRVNNAYKVR
jgi:hypothetical protein